VHRWRVNTSERKGLTDKREIALKKEIMRTSVRGNIRGKTSTYGPKTAKNSPVGKGLSQGEWKKKLRSYLEDSERGKKKLPQIEKTKVRGRGQ